MSESGYWGDVKDYIEATSAGLEAYFKEFAKIQDDFVSGKVTHTTVVAAAVKFDELAIHMERAREAFLAKQSIN